MATFPSKVNYATGDILTATNMNDVGGAINLLDGAQTSAGINRVLNSNFSVWQRGTSVSIAASVGGYSADRWYLQNGANQAMTLSRQATSDTTNLPNIQYCIRVQRNSGQTGTTQINFGQPFETLNSVALAGKTITLSFYARAGANYSPTSSVINAGVSTGTGTDQNYPSYTGFSGIANENKTLTTTWQRFTTSGTVGTSVTEIAPVFSIIPTGTAGANDYFEITGIQIEVASTASPYAPNGATQQAELAACQRYYIRYAGSATYSKYGIGYAYSTTAAVLQIPNPVTMRVVPTAIEYSTQAISVENFGSIAITALTINGQCQTQPITLTATVASGATQFRPYDLSNNNSASGYVALSAEL